MNARAMSTKKKTAKASPNLLLEKTPSGIEGLDTVTGGGLPRGRPTLVCGSPGCGKTLFGLQFLIDGANRGEPGVIIAFEETAEDLAMNVASLGVDLQSLIRRKKIAVDHVHVDRSEILETGGYDLSGLFVRIAHAIDAIGAKRIVLDTLEVLFTGFSNAALMRSELERLFHWLKEKGMTAVITGERGDGALTRHGLEEYVSDCVIFLDQRVTEQVTTRRLRIVKYRGSSHGTNEYPFLIDERGISVLPLTGLGLDYPVSTERVSSGVPSLDEMLGGKGYFRGSSILVSGTAGTGKSSVAASYAAAAGSRGEKCIYFALEEPAAQVTRNMRSIGLELAPLMESGTLKVVAARPTVFGLEQHLATMHALIEKEKPRAVIVDPISSLVTAGNFHDVKSMLVRLFDYLKLRRITGIFTYLTSPHGLQETDVGVSSLIDTWIELRDLEHRGERNRAVYILKSRGMPHSNQVREFLITSKGLDLVDAFIGPEGVLIGSARVNQEADEVSAEIARKEELERRGRALDRRRKVTEAQIDVMRADVLAEEEEYDRAKAELGASADRLRERRSTMRQSKYDLSVTRPASAAATTASGPKVEPRRARGRRSA
jgi:circadian clock protein KaiC